MKNILFQRIWTVNLWYTLSLGTVFNSFLFVLVCVYLYKYGIFDRKRRFAIYRVNVVTFHVSHRCLVFNTIFQDEIFIPFQNKAYVRIEICDMLSESNHWTSSYTNVQMRKKNIFINNDNSNTYDIYLTQSPFDNVQWPWLIQVCVFDSNSCYACEQWKQKKNSWKNIQFTWLQNMYNGNVCNWHLYDKILMSVL